MIIDNVHWMVIKMSTTVSRTDDKQNGFYIVKSVNLWKMSKKNVFTEDNSNTDLLIK